jgi:hypothetical protein
MAKIAPRPTEAMSVSSGLQRLRWSQPCSAAPAVADLPPSLAPSDSAPPRLSRAPSPPRSAVPAERARRVARESHGSPTAKLPDPFLPLNGRPPVSISYRTTPSEKISLRPSTVCPDACSGDMYAIVPTTNPGRVCPSVVVRVAVVCAACGSRSPVASPAQNQPASRSRSSR